MVQLKQIREYIESNDLVIPSTVMHLFNQFLTYQMISLSDICIDTKKVRTEFIIKANKLLEQEWKVHYHNLLKLIHDTNPYPHGFFNREIVRFFLILAYYYYVQDQYDKTQVVLLSYAKYMFSVHFKTYFPNGCIDDVMQMALDYMKGQSLIKKFELNYHQLCQYIVKHSFKSFTESLGRKNHPDVIFQIMRNISTRLKQTLKPLGQAYYEAYKQYKESGVQYDTGIQISKQELIQQMKLHVEDSIEALPKSVFNNLKLTQYERDIKSFMKLNSNLIIRIFSDLVTSELKVRKMITDISNCKNLKAIKRAMYFSMHKSKSFMELLDIARNDGYDYLINPQANLKHIVSYILTLCWKMTVCH